MSIRDEWTTEDGSIRLLLGDCLEILPGLGKVDAVVTDPPYGIDYKSGREGVLDRSIIGDETTELRDSVLSLGYATACFATARCTPPMRPKGVLVWEKNTCGMGDLSFPWMGNFEVVWIFGSGWSGDRRSSVLRASTVCTWNTGPAARLHPHQKPVDLLEQIVDTAPAGTILDPFMGSGTTGLACIRLGRRFIGIEREPKYFEIAKKRIRDELAKTALIEKPKRLVQKSFVEATL